MSAAPRDTGAAQSRLLLVVEALAGSEVFGQRLSDIAQAAGASMPTTLRDLRTLAASGWAAQDEDGRWRLTSRPLQIIFDFQAGLASAHQRVEAVGHNYTRQPV
jgi:DNA-binding IclR family transcriptional regulator